MSATIGSTAVSPTRARIGLAISAFVALFLLFDAVIHILRIDSVDEASATLGFAPESMVFVGLVELVCVALYVVPRTAVLGAVALTGYLGGAFTAQLRIEAPTFSTLLFPVYVGLLVWVGLCLRDGRVRAALSAPRS